MLTRRLFALGFLGMPYSKALAQSMAMIRLAPKLPGAVTPLTSQIPDALGRGFLSTTGETLTVITDVSKTEKQQQRSSALEANVVDSRSTFAKAISWSVSAKAGFGDSGGASARVSASTDYHSSNKQLTIVLNKLVKDTDYFIRDPQIRHEALVLLSHNKQAFLQRYGDCMIQSVMTGGILSIVYTLNFASMEETDEFKASISGHYTTTSAAADFSQSVKKAASKASINMKAFSSGVDNPPPLFNSVGGEGTTGQIGVDDTVANDLYHYFDNFDQAVYASLSLYPVYFATQKTDIMSNVPAGSIPSLSNRIAALALGSDLDDTIDKRLADATYFRDVAHAWNPGVDNIGKAQALVTALTTRENLLNQYETKIANLDPKCISIPFGEADIETLPASWKVQQLEVVSEQHFKIEGGPTVKEISIDLPDHADGVPAKIDWSLCATWGASNPTVSYLISFVAADGSNVKTIENASLSGADSIRSMLFLDHFNAKVFSAIENVPLKAVRLSLAINKDNLTWFLDDAKYSWNSFLRLSM